MNATLASSGPRSIGTRVARLFPAVLIGTALAVAVIGLAIGRDYYALPLQERPFADDYERFRPAGAFGLRYGIVGFGLIALGVAGYSLRKRVRWLARAGKLRTWLELHIFVCTVGPFLVTLHTSFTVGGLVSIAYWSMVVVAVSGIFGRYVYARIPKTVQGQFAGLAAVEAERAALLAELEADLGPRARQVEALLRPARRAGGGLLAALWAALRADVARGTVLRRVRGALASGGVAGPARTRVLALAERQLDLEQQVALMLPFQRLFRYWHILHLPLAIAMFVIVAVHVVVATLFGFGFT